MINLKMSLIIGILLLIIIILALSLAVVTVIQRVQRKKRRIAASLYDGVRKQETDTGYPEEQSEILTVLNKENQEESTTEKLENAAVTDRGQHGFLRPNKNAKSRLKILEVIEIVHTDEFIPM